MGHAAGEQASKGVGQEGIQGRGRELSRMGQKGEERRFGRR